MQCNAMQCEEGRIGENECVSSSPPKTNKRKTGTDAVAAMEIDQPSALRSTTSIVSDAGNGYWVLILGDLTRPIPTRLGTNS